MNPISETRYVRSVDRAIDVIAAVARGDAPMTLGDIVRAVSAPKSTTLNIVRTLVRRRLLETDGATKKYRVGRLLLALVGSARESVDLARLARPRLNALARATGESVLLGVLEGDELVYLEKVDSPQPIQYVAQAGTRRPLHCTSGGKLCLAMQPPAAWDSYIERVGLRRYTAKTITRPVELRRELKRIRDRGYAVSQGEFIPDLIGVSAPVFEGHGGVFAGLLTVPAPAFRMRRNLTRVVTALREEAASLTLELGASMVAVRSGERKVNGSMALARQRQS
jgi:DNA-binding IclR family transcriptional regulator